MSTRLIKYYLDKYIYLAPIVMLVITLYSNFFDLNYVIIGNLIGYSILTNIVLWYLFNVKGNYCWFTKNVPLGLIAINLLDITAAFINYEYYARLFNILVCTVSLFLFMIFKIKTMIK
tara:strand:- start:405 stop:758 length:354 start_codon:yes stop_codon:yes gene_type:complete